MCRSSSQKVSERCEIKSGFRRQEKGRPTWDFSSPELPLPPQLFSSLGNNNEDYPYFQPTILVRSQVSGTRAKPCINNNFHPGKHTPLLCFPAAYVTHTSSKRSLGRNNKHRLLPTSVKFHGSFNDCIVLVPI